MRAGKRRSFITIEVPTNVKQANGSMLTTWSTFNQLWASIETLRGNERATATAIWPTADQKITFRYIFGVLPTMRIVFNDTVYSILNVNNVDMRGRELQLLTNSGVKAS